MVRTQAALLLVDPWLDGPVFNNCWSLLDQGTDSAELVERLNRCGLPVYVWYSRPDPDHFSLPFIRRLKGEFRGVVTFLYLKGRDRRVPGLLRRNRFAVAELDDGVPATLGKDLRISALGTGEGGSACLVNAGGRTVLSLTDCRLASAAQCRALRERVARLAPRVDVMLTGFGFASWMGNPDDSALRKAAADERAARMALQIAQFNPRLAVPAGSFAYFSHPDNAWLNDGQATPARLLEADPLEDKRHIIRFLRPGDGFDLDRDTAASLTLVHERALEHWMALWKGGLRLQPRPKPSSFGEVRTAFLQYRERVGEALYGLPRLLELARAIRPLVLYLHDLRQTVSLSYRHGLVLRERDLPFDIALGSPAALHLLRDAHGFETTHAGGCFRTGHRGALLAFSRFFLPQRMAARGYDRRRPLEAGRFLLVTGAAVAARQLRAALR